MSYTITKSHDGGLTKTPDGYSASVIYTVVAEGEASPSKYGALKAVPGIGSIYPDAIPNVRLHVRTQDAKQDGNNRWVFKVTNNFEQSKGDEPEGELAVDDDPLLRLPVVSFTVQTISVPTDRDYAGNPLVNSARDAIDNLPSVDLYILEFKITKNLPSFPAKDFYDYYGKLNDADYKLPGGYLIPKHQGRIKYIVPVGEYDTGSTTYVKVEYCIAVAPFGWDFEFIDQGFGQYVNVDDEPTKLKILDGSAQPIQKPALLDGKGAVMGSGINNGVGLPDGATSRATEYANFLKYRLFEEMDFFNLKLTFKKNRA